MLRKTLDKLLVIYFNKQYDTSKLDHLEQDVWRKIRMQTADMALPWYEKIVMAFAVPEFRMVSIAMAVVIGLVFSPVITFSSSASASEAMGLQVFATNTPYLLTNQIAGK